GQDVPPRFFPRGFVLPLRPRRRRDQSRVLLVFLLRSRPLFRLRRLGGLGKETREGSGAFPFGGFGRRFFRRFHGLTLGRSGACGFGLFLRRGFGSGFFLRLRLCGRGGRQ